MSQMNESNRIKYELVLYISIKTTGKFVLFNFFNFYLIVDQNVSHKFMCMI